MLESVLQRHISTIILKEEVQSTKITKCTYLPKLTNTSATSHDINTTSRVNEIRKAQQIPLSLLKAIKKFFGYFILQTYLIIFYS